MVSGWRGRARGQEMTSTVTTRTTARPAGRGRATHRTGGDRRGDGDVEEQRGGSVGEGLGLDRRRWLGHHPADPRASRVVADGGDPIRRGRVGGHGPRHDGVALLRGARDGTHR